MKKSIIGLVLSMFLVSCGYNEGPRGHDGTPGVNGIDGKDGTSGVDGKDGSDGADGQDFTPEAKTSLSGYWMLPNGGYLELIEDADGHILVNGTQRVYIQNSDSSLGLIPALGAGPYFQREGVIRLEFVPTYVALTNNVYGVTPVAIVGARKTVVTLKLSSGKLSINVKVYGASGLTIDTDKTVLSE